MRGKCSFSAWVFRKVGDEILPGETSVLWEMLSASLVQLRRRSCTLQLQELNDWFPVQNCFVASVSALKWQGSLDPAESREAEQGVIRIPNTKRHRINPALYGGVDGGCTYRTDILDLLYSSSGYPTISRCAVVFLSIGDRRTPALE